MFYFTYFPPAIFWLIVGIFLGAVSFFVKPGKITLMLFFVFISGLFVGGYFSWIEAIKAQVGTCIAQGGCGCQKK